MLSTTRLPEFLEYEAREDGAKLEDEDPLNELPGYRLVSHCGSKLDIVQSELEVLEPSLDNLRDLVYGFARQSTTSATEGSNTAGVPTVASRVAFPQELRGFNPSPFLSPEFRRAFEDPDSLFLEDRPPAPAAPLTSSRTELWHLMWR